NIPDSVLMGIATDRPWFTVETASVNPTPPTLNLGTAVKTAPNPPIRHVVENSAPIFNQASKIRSVCPIALSDTFRNPVTPRPSLPARPVAMRTTPARQVLERVAVPALPIVRQAA